jgi:RNA polymerase sigma factor (sigma-70 family)
MCRHKPPNVELIFAKAGEKWTDVEQDSAWLWLHEGVRLRRLLLIALDNLGPGATPQDAEDAWSDFQVERLNTVFKTYVPNQNGTSRFWKYVVFCLRRHCWDLRKRRARELALVKTMGWSEEGGQSLVELAVDMSGSTDPGELVGQAEDADALGRALLRLPEELREVTRLRFFEEFTLQEVGRRLGCSPATAYRREVQALQMLRDWLCQDDPGFGR